MTQVEFGQALGWNERTVRRYIRGELSARLDVAYVANFIQLLDAAGMTLEDLPVPHPPTQK